MTWYIRWMSATIVNALIRLTSRNNMSLARRMARKPRTRRPTTIGTAICQAGVVLRGAQTARKNGERIVHKWPYKALGTAMTQKQIQALGTHALNHGKVPLLYNIKKLTWWGVGYQNTCWFIVGIYIERYTAALSKSSEAGNGTVQSRVILPRNGFRNNSGIFSSTDGSTALCTSLLEGSINNRIQACGTLSVLHTHVCAACLQTVRKVWNLPSLAISL